MSGKVKITAVGKGELYNSIEDDIYSSNLEIELDKNYGVLIPNMPINIIVNCKVSKSTTQPLLRARLDVEIINNDNSTIDDVAMMVVSDINSQLDSIITSENWYQYSDGFYYYVQSTDLQIPGNSQLREIDARRTDIIVPFINKGITFPKYVNSQHSGMGIKIRIIFQAIQNYIPDNNGNKIANTIRNSLTIFDNFAKDNYINMPANNFNVSKTGDKVSISFKEGVEYPSNVKLPERTSDGELITNISKDLFSGSATIKNVYIPSSYTSIDDRAFEKSGIITVDASDSQITKIPNYAFYNSKITSIKLPKTCVEIGNFAFNGSFLQSIELPDALTTIGSCAIFSCNYLVSLKIPANVNSISDNGICYNSNLKYVEVDDANSKYYDVDNKMIVSSDGKLLCYTCGSDDKILTIPDEVVELCENTLSFAHKLSKIVLGKNLAYIKTQLSHRLTSIDIASNTNFVQKDDGNGNQLFMTKDNKKIIIAFLSSTASTLNIIDGVESIAATGNSASGVPNITTLQIGKDFKCNDGGSGNVVINLSKLCRISVSEQNTTLKTVTGKELMSKNGKNFYRFVNYPSITTYSVPDGVEEIRPYAFYYVRTLEELTIPNSTTTLYVGAIYGMYDLKKINGMENLSNINGYALSYCNQLQELKIGGAIKQGVAAHNTNLKSITIYGNCTSISERFADNCTNLEWVEFQGDEPPTFESSLMFQNTNTSFVIYVPDDAVEDYKSAKNFTIFANRIKPVSQKS